MAELIEEKKFVNLSQYNFTFSLSNKLGRVLWNSCYWIFFRPFFLNVFKNWRCFVLRLFGAKIGKHSCVYSDVKIWAPWNLELGNNSCIGSGVDCYNQGKVIIGDQTIISQKTYLCASTHDYTKSDFPLKLGPIHIKDQVWIAADVFVAPGVSIGQGAVIGARSAVVKNVDAWIVVGGNPARLIKKRTIAD